MRQARVSVVLPFYCSNGYLEEAVESVLAQRDFDDWHLYLVDDGSDDRDVKIANRYSHQYPGTITLLAHEGRQWRGISASRNLGIRCSAGDLVAFLDADDTWLPHRLSYQVARLNDYPVADMIYGPAVRWHSWRGGSDRYVSAMVDGFGSDCLVPGIALLDTFLRDEAMTPCIGSVMVHRSALVRAGLFEEKFCGLYDDQVLYAKLSRFAQVFVSSECVSRYRQHAQSICRQGEMSGEGEREHTRFLTWLREHHETVEPALSSR